jgi:hypothetical protein
MMNRMMKKISSAEAAARTTIRRNVSRMPAGLLVRRPTGRRVRPPPRALAPDTGRPASRRGPTAAPASHTARTRLKKPWATWGPLWPLSRVQVRVVPGHLVAHQLALKPRAGLMWPYRLIASRCSSTVSLIRPTLGGLRVGCGRRSRLLPSWMSQRIYPKSSRVSTNPQVCRLFEVTSHARCSAPDSYEKMAHQPASDRFAKLYT